MEFIIVGIGGFIGSCLRYGFNKFAIYLNISFPLGTLMSNVVAGVTIGFIIGLESNTFSFSPKTKLFLTTGLLGGLSTFSTFSIETVTLFNDGKHLLAAGNILLNLILSLSGVVLGMAAARLINKN